MFIENTSDDSIPSNMLFKLSVSNLMLNDTDRIEEMYKRCFIIGSRTPEDFFISYRRLGDSLDGRYIDALKEINSMLVSYKNCE